MCNSSHSGRDNLAGVPTGGDDSVVVSSHSGQWSSWAPSMTRPQYSQAGSTALVVTRPPQSGHWLSSEATGTSSSNPLSYTSLIGILFTLSGELGSTRTPLTDRGNINALGAVGQAGPPTNSERSVGGESPAAQGAVRA